MKENSGIKCWEKAGKERKKEKRKYVRKKGMKNKNTEKETK